MNGQWLTLTPTKRLEVENLVLQGQTHILAAFLAGARPTVTNEDGVHYFLRPLCGRLGPVGGEIAPGLFLCPPGTTHEVRAVDFAGFAQVDTLVDVHRWRATAKAGGPEATRPILSEELSDLRTPGVDDRLGVLRDFIRARASLVYGSSRRLRGLPGDCDQVEIFNMARGLLIRPELAAQELFISLQEEAHAREHPEPIHEWVKDGSSLGPGLTHRRGALIGHKPLAYRGPEYETLERVALQVAEGTNAFVRPGEFIL